MLDRRRLNQLRLKYEHSVSTCRLCGRKGIVGENLKLMDAAPSDKPDPLPQDLMIRCADRQACQRRQEKQRAT